MKNKKDRQQRNFVSLANTGCSKNEGVAERKILADASKNFILVY
jgi:hypothetical protein